VGVPARRCRPLRLPAERRSPRRLPVHHRLRSSGAAISC
jgi:hypothetical protein